MIIKDGRSGDTVDVYSNHHMAVQSIEEPVIGYKSRAEELGFSMFTPFGMPLTTTERCIMIIYNGETEKQFVLNTLFISSNGGATFNRHLIARLYKGASAPTTGIYGGVPITFGNLNIGSSKTTGVKAYLWDGSTGDGLTGGAAGSPSMFGYFPAEFTAVQLNGSVVLSPGQYARVTYQGEAAMSAGFTVSGYLTTKEIL